MIPSVTTTTPTRVRTPGLGQRPGGGRPDDGRPPDRGEPLPPSPRTYRLGMIFALAGISMLFLGFTSAYVVRQGLGGDWQPLDWPPVLWVNTVVLLTSSATLWRAGIGFHHHRWRSFARWTTVTFLLGLGFLAGQLWVWHQLRMRGIYLNTNPNSSFFYLLTGTHGVHLAGGVVALLWLSALAWRLVRPTEATSATIARCRIAVDVTSLYWHFLDGLWVFLVLLLFLWR